jgi:hypothetical protein
MPFPTNSIRGIANNSLLIEDRFVAPTLFNFEQKFRRADGLIPLSINWEDNDAVRAFTLNQLDNGQPKYKAGLAIIPRSELDSLSQRPAIEGFFSYERDELKDNPYHGNLLVKSNVPPTTKKMIAHGLALASTLSKRSNE